MSEVDTCEAQIPFEVTVRSEEEWDRIKYRSVLNGLVVNKQNVKNEGNKLRVSGILYCDNKLRRDDDNNVTGVLYDTCPFVADGLEKSPHGCRLQDLVRSSQAQQVDKSK